MRKWSGSHDVDQQFCASAAAERPGIGCSLSVMQLAGGGERNLATIHVLVLQDAAGQRVQRAEAGVKDAERGGDHGEGADMGLEARFQNDDHCDGTLEKERRGFLR